MLQIGWLMGFYILYTVYPMLGWAHHPCTGNGSGRSAPQEALPAGCGGNIEKWRIKSHSMHMRGQNTLHVIIPSASAANGGHSILLPSVHLDNSSGPQTLPTWTRHTTKLNHTIPYNTKLYHTGL